MRRIVAFGHRQRTGKDTLAGFVAQQLKMETRGRSVAVMGFANLLKEIAFRLWCGHGMQRGPFYETHPNERDTILPHLDCTVRQAWIKLGNHMRELDSECWINAALATPSDYVIIKDMRFPNEFEAVKKAGGICIKVVRPSEPEQTDGADDQLHYPDSSWDKIIVNDKGLKELSEHATTIIQEFSL
jgi:hypothetical protein